jgi:hypothetical protein
MNEFLYTINNLNTFLQQIKPTFLKSRAKQALGILTLSAKNSSRTASAFVPLKLSSTLMKPVVTSRRTPSVLISMYVAAAAYRQANLVSVRQTRQVHVDYQIYLHGAIQFSVHRLNDFGVINVAEKPPYASQGEMLVSLRCYLIDVSGVAISHLDERHNKILTLSGNQLG